MNPSSLLDPVIRVIAPGTRSSPFGKVIHVDSRTGEQVKPSIFRTSVRTFVISSGSGTTVSRKGMKICGPRFVLLLDYTVHCAEDCEAAAAKAFFACTTPQEYLESQVETICVRLISDRPEDLVSRPLDLIREATSQLEDAIARRTGLTFAAQIVLEEPVRFRPRRLGPLDLELRACDSDFAFNLQIAAVLSVDPNESLRAWREVEKLEKVLDDLPVALEELAARSIPLHQFHAHRDRVAAAFRQRIGENLEGCGWIVDRFDLTGGPEIQGLLESLPLSWKWTFQPSDQKYPVEVGLEALLVLSDLAAYVGARCPSLEPSGDLGRVLEEIARLELFNLASAQLASRKSDLEGRLAERCAGLFQQLGYHAQPAVHLVGVAACWPERIEVGTSYRFPEVGVEIGVLGDLLIEIGDPDRYVVAGSPLFQDCCQQLLLRVGNELLFPRQLADLIREEEVLSATFARLIVEQSAAIGLEATAKIRFANLPAIPPIASIDRRAERRLALLQKPVGIDLQARLQLVDATPLARAGAFDLDSRFEAAFQDAINEVFLSASGADVLTQTLEYEHDLRDRLAEHARAFGYAGDILVALGFGEPEFVPSTTRKASAHQSVGTTQPLEVRGTVVLILEDPKKYIEAGRPDFTDWWRQELGEAAAEELFGWSLPRICLEGDKKREELESRLILAAGEIGYRARVEIEFVGASAHLYLALSVEHNVDILLQDSSKIVAKVRMGLRLEDPKSLLKEKIVDVSAYVRREIEAVANANISRRTRGHLSIFPAEIEREICESLEKCLGRLGYSTDSQVLLLGVDHEISDVKRVRCSGDYSLNNFPDRVHIDSEILLRIVDRGRYVSSGCVDLEAWARKEIDEATRDHLFQCEFTDLCIALDTHKDAIKVRVREAAEGLGCAIQHLLTSTDLLPEVLTRGVPIALDADYPSRNPTFPIGLRVNVRYQITDLAPLRETIRKYPKLVPHLEEEIERCVAKELRELNPGDFYETFQEPNGRGVPGVARKIRQVVCEVLEKKFFADVLDFACEQRVPPYAGILASLVRTSHPISVKTERVRGEPNPEFEGDLRVEGLAPNGLETFNETKPEIKDLVGSTERFLIACLADQALSSLVAKANGELQREISESLRANLSTQFGLNVTLCNWRRRPLPLETKAAQYLDDVARWQYDTADQLRKTISALRIQLHQKELVGAPLAAVVEIESRIRRLEGQLFNVLCGSLASSVADSVANHALKAGVDSDHRLPAEVDSQ